MITKEKLKQTLQYNGFSITKTCTNLSISTTHCYKLIKQYDLTDYYTSNKKKPAIYYHIKEVNDYLKAGLSISEIGKKIGMSKSSLDYHLGYSTRPELSELRATYSKRLKAKHLR